MGSIKSKVFIDLPTDPVVNNNNQVEESRSTKLLNCPNYTQSQVNKIVSFSSSTSSSTSSSSSSSSYLEVSNINISSEIVANSPSSNLNSNINKNNTLDLMVNYSTMSQTTSSDQSELKLVDEQSKPQVNDSLVSTISTNRSNMKTVNCISQSLDDAINDNDVEHYEDGIDNVANEFSTLNDSITNIAKLQHNNSNNFKSSFFRSFRSASRRFFGLRKSPKDLNTSVNTELKSNYNNNHDSDNQRKRITIQSNSSKISSSSMKNLLLFDMKESIVESDTPRPKHSTFKSKSHTDLNKLERMQLRKSSSRMSVKSLADACVIRLNETKHREKRPVLEKGSASIDNNVKQLSKSLSSIASTQLEKQSLSDKINEPVQIESKPNNVQLRVVHRKVRDVKNRSKSVYIENLDSDNKSNDFPALSLLASDVGTREAKSSKKSGLKPNEPADFDFLNENQQKTEVLIDKLNEQIGNLSKKLENIGNNAEKEDMIRELLDKVEGLSQMNSNIINSIGTQKENKFKEAQFNANVKSSIAKKLFEDYIARLNRQNDILHVQQSQIEELKQSLFNANIYLHQQQHFHYPHLNQTGYGFESIYKPEMFNSTTGNYPSFYYSNNSNVAYAQNNVGPYFYQEPSQYFYPSATYANQSSQSIYGMSQSLYYDPVTAQYFYQNVVPNENLMSNNAANNYQNIYSTFSDPYNRSSSYDETDFAFRATKQNNANLPHYQHHHYNQYHINGHQQQTHQQKQYETQQQVIITEISDDENEQTSHLRQGRKSKEYVDAISLKEDDDESY